MAILFRLTKVEVPQFAILTDKEFPDPIRINYGFEFSVDINLSLIRCDATISYINQEAPVMKIVVRCEYFIESDSWSSLKKDGRITFPAGFLQHLASLTTGTARGAYYGKTEGTIFNRFFIPLLDVKQAVKEDLSLPDH
jgi:hypothetical protein